MIPTLITASPNGPNASPVTIIPEIIVSNTLINATGSSQSFTGSYTLTYTNDESTLTTGEGLQFNFTFPDESPFNCYAVALNWKITSSVGSVTYANDSEICIHIDPTISIAEQYSSRDVRIDDKFTSSGPFSSSSTIVVYGGWKPYKVTWQYENLSVGKWENITTTVGDSDSSTLYSFSLAGTYEIRAHLVDNANYQVWLPSSIYTYSTGRTEWP